MNHTEIAFTRNNTTYVVVPRINMFTIYHKGKKIFSLKNLTKEEKTAIGQLLLNNQNDDNLEEKLRAIR